MDPVGIDVDHDHPRGVYPFLKPILEFWHPVLFKGCAIVDQARMALHVDHRARLANESHHPARALEGQPNTVIAPEIADFAAVFVTISFLLQAQAALCRE